VLQAMTAEVDAKTVAYRDARRDLEQMMKALIEAQQQLRAAEQGITEAKRQAFLQAHHPDLLAKLASLREEDPTQRIDAMHPRYYALQAQWRAQVRQVEAEIAEALQAIETP
jgi:chromosome segregation ATPase